VWLFIDSSPSLDVREEGSDGSSNAPWRTREAHTICPCN